MDEHSRSALLAEMGIDQWQVRSAAGHTEEAGTFAAACQAVTHCNACSLASATQPPLAGVGSEQATLLVIAECASAEGKTFNLKAGQLFAAMMRAIQCPAKAIFITNTIKCSSDNKPEKNEAKHCRTHLDAQIKTLQPHAVLCLGSLAAQTLLKTETPVSTLREEAHEIHGIPVVVSYHPEYLLHQPSQKAAVWQDLLQLSFLL